MTLMVMTCDDVTVEMMIFSMKCGWEYINSILLFLENEANEWYRSEADGVVMMIYNY